MPEGLLIADGEGVPTPHRHLGEIERPRELPPAGACILGAAAETRRMDAAQITRGAVGDMDRMGAAQQLQQGPKANGLIVGMGDHQRDRGVHKAAGAQIAHDAMGWSGDAG